MSGGPVEELARRMWEAAKDAIEPLGDDRYRMNSFDDDEAISAMTSTLAKLLRNGGRSI